MSCCYEIFNVLGELYSNEFIISKFFAVMSVSCFFCSINRVFLCKQDWFGNTAKSLMQD